MAALESAIGVTPFMLAYAVRADTESTSVTYIPPPSVRQFFLAALARNQAHSAIDSYHPNQQKRVVDKLSSLYSLDVNIVRRLDCTLSKKNSHSHTFRRGIHCDISATISVVLPVINCELSHSSKEF